MNIVDRIVHAVWNEHRSWDIEHAIHNVQMVKNEPTVAAQYNNPPNRTRTALAIVDLAKEPALPLMQR